MARPRIPLAVIWEKEPDHISRLILNELILYAKDRQFYPVRRALWRYMAYPAFNPATRKLDPPRYPDVELNLYDYWFSRLVSEGYIEIDQNTSAIRCVNLEITEKDD